ncbi:MAG: hypothetical protein WCJ58_02770 [bacterium]
MAQTTQVKKSKKNWIIFGIVVGLLLIICCCCSITIGFVKLMNIGIAKSNEIKTEVVFPMCVNKQLMTSSDYTNWFSASYRSSTSLDETKVLLSDAFPVGYNCQDLYVNNLLELFQKGESFSVSYSSTAGNTADLSFTPVKGRRISFKLTQIDSQWKVTAMSKSVF